MNILKNLFLLLMPLKWRINRSTNELLKKARNCHLTANGFVIISNLLDNNSNQKESTYYWEEIDNIRIKNDTIEFLKDNLIIETVSKNLDDNYIFDYYNLLKNIPEGYKDFDYDYVRTLFDSLTGCIICGTIAIKDNKCLSCGFRKWNSKDFDFISEEEYNKEEQYDLFEPLDDEEIDINNRQEGAFLPDPTWVPLVKEEDYQKQ